jgi:hypothetical protein
MMASLHLAHLDPLVSSNSFRYCEFTLYAKPSSTVNLPDGSLSASTAWYTIPVEIVADDTGIRQS